MKKNLMNILLTSLSIFSALTLASCALFKDYEKECMQSIEDFVKYLNNDNVYGIKSLFAKNKINEDRDFDVSIDSLLSYYDLNDGKLEFSEIPGEEGDRGDNYVAKWFQAPYKIDINDKIQYRLAFYWCFYYTVDNKHIDDFEGIWSFYIIKETEYETPEYDYWGDGNWTPGINIGIQ